MKVLGGTLNNKKLLKLREGSLTTLVPSVLLSLVFVFLFGTYYEVLFL